jgi:hypothetical protein
VERQEIEATGGKMFQIEILGEDWNQ